MLGELMTSFVPSLKGDKVAIDVDAVRQDSVSADIAARFAVQNLLGEGGMGSVFVAQDKGLGRIVALKRLRDGLEKDAGAMRRFVLEAQIGAQLEHPNIVPLYSFEHSENGSPAITMQLLEGTTMDEYIAAAAKAPAAARLVRGEYSLKERVGKLLGVCEAIHFAHERGVIHRDLKPHNIMLGRYREVYVMDWGLARVIGSPIDMASERASARDDDDEADAEVLGSLPTVASFDEPASSQKAPLATRQGEVMGTPQYMPPEQALGLIDKVAPAADQYSLGVMLQELATLRPARSHTSTMAALTQALQNHLEEPIDANKKPMNPALLAIVRRATQRDPEKRYPSVREMSEDLRCFIRDEPVSVYPEGLSRRLVRAAARRPGLAFGILSLCGFLASVTIAGGVIHDAHKTERAAQQLELTRRLIIAASGRAHAIDVELSDVAAGVHAVGAATVELLDRNAADFDRHDRPMPSLTPHEAYGWAPVSFEASVVTWPGKVPQTELSPNAARLVRAEHWLRTCVVDGLPSGDRGGSVPQQNAALTAGRSSLLRCFVGLEDGSFTQFPARDVTADPRKRPWYAMAKRDPALHWTRPVVDATKRTLRISALLGLRARGSFLGVAGCDLRVPSLAQKLRLGLDGFRQAYLVTEDGKIAVSEKLETAMLVSTKDPDEPLELPALDDSELARRIAGSERGGSVVTGDRLFVFAKLISPPWTYVVELDNARYQLD